MKTKMLLRLSAAAIALSASAHAGEPEDLAALKKEISDLRQEYDARIADLEARLKAAEDSKAPASQAAPVVASAPAAPAPVEVASAPPTPVSRPPITQSAYNPGIAASLQGQYAYSQRDPSAAQIPGFPLSDEAGLPSRGLSLDESEVSFFANVDHRVYANLTVSLDNNNDVSVEEAYIQSKSLPGGFTLKAGRFYSGIAYLNERHTHDWDFVDAPLPYRAFLGNQLGDDGIEVRWVAPTDFYLEV
ncbi:MAG: hypothetical protein R3C60_12080 [Parvularculaceae bacterium]